MKISACTITKNEEKNIAKSINSYKKYVDEIIIVDTGSNDNTVKIAQDLGAKVINFQWEGDFSKAKNCAIDNATGDFIIFLDADEWFTEETAGNIKSVIEFAVKQNYDAVATKFINIDDKENVLEVISCLRLFAKKPHIRFKRRIHEMLFDMDKDIPMTSLYTDKLVIKHSGYNPKTIQQKMKRNLSLLEKNYAMGLATTLDYLYLTRENTSEDANYAKFYLDKLKSRDDYEEMLKGINLSNSIYDIQIKVAKLLPQEYSFEDNLTLVEEGEEKDKGNPIYQYYKYLLYKDLDNDFALECLLNAIKMDEKYEENNKGKNSAFYRKKASALYQLGKEALKLNDSVTAMEYFVKSLKTKDYEANALLGLMQIIAKEKIEDVILFINSVVDVESENGLKFLVETLRLTKYHQIFLYYFVKWNKKFNEVDVSLFTSRLITGNFLEIATIYRDILLSQGEEKAMMLIASAIIAGDLKEFYEQNKHVFLPEYLKILNNYFNNEQIDSVTIKDIEIFEAMFKEIAYIISDEKIERLINVFASMKEKVLNIALMNYMKNLDYELVLKIGNKVIEENIEELNKAAVHSILGICYFRMGNLEQAKQNLSIAMKLGDLKDEVYVIYSQLLGAEGTDENEFLEDYRNNLECFKVAKKLMEFNKIKDIENLEINSTEDFMEAIREDEVKVSKAYLELFYNFANKNFEMKNFGYAENYYMLLVKQNFENKAMCLYRLGEIYNNISKPDVSFAAFKEAFICDLKLSSKLVGKEHNSYYYVYADEKEEHVDKCPVCGGTGVPKYCFNNIQDNNLTDEVSLVVKFNMCDKCNHLFAGNFRNGNSLEKITDKEYNKLVADAYELANELECSNVLVVDENDAIRNTLANEEFDTQYICARLDKCHDIEELIKEIKAKKKENEVIVFDVFNFMSAYKNERPIYAKAGVLNVFSKKSISEMLKKYDINVNMIYNCRYAKGKMFVVAK